MVIGFRCFSLWFWSSILVFLWGRLAVPPQEARGKHLQSPRADRRARASLSFLKAESARIWRDLPQQSIIKLVFLEARRRISDEVFIVCFSGFMTNVPGVSSRHLWIYTVASAEYQGIMWKYFRCHGGWHPTMYAGMKRTISELTFQYC